MIPQYLSELLLRFDTVILPGLGSFQLKNVPASIKGESILPPGKILLFDTSVINNDGVLANYISEKNKISFFDACEQILEFVEKIQKELNKGNDVSLEKIGMLKRNSSGNIIFSADTGIDYSTDSFGLTSITATPHANKVKETITTSDNEEHLPRKKKNFPVAAIWIIAVVMILGAGASGVYFLRPDLLMKIGINIDRQKQNDKPSVINKNQENISAANKKDSAKNILQTNNNAQSQQRDSVRYYIIAASFRIKENADNYAVQLNGMGHKSEIIFVPEKNLYAVSYNMYDDKAQAGQALEDIKTSKNPAAWIMEK